MSYPHGNLRPPAMFHLRNAVSSPCRQGGSLSTAYALLPLILFIAACKPPPDARHHMPQADAARGKAAIERVGCASCHDIPGIRWPQGTLGPSLAGYAERGLIAGRLPNRPDVLAAFVRDAPSLVPETTMPSMPLKEGESRDVAAYLYTLSDR
jgi:cytochrome c1